MASQFTINQIVSFQQISQFLAGNDKSAQKQLKSGSFIGNLPALLYMEGYLLQNLNSLSPSSATLRPTAEYVLSLCGIYLIQAQNIRNNIAQSPPVITGPANQSTTVGGSATFSVSVTGTAPFTYQWFLGGVAIPGAMSSSYVISNALVSQNGGLYSVNVTNAAGSVTSSQATLTIESVEVAYYYQGNTDYSAELVAGIDNVPYTGTVAITSGQPITVPFPNIGATEYIILKYPSTEPAKTTYLNPPPSGPDNGTIPSLALDDNNFGGWSYVFSRQGNPFGLNSVNGQVKFS